MIPTAEPLRQINASFQIHPENLKKRQVKAPKIYIHDSGLFHSLLQALFLPSIFHVPANL